MARGVRITTAWAWLLHDAWPDPSPAGQDRAFVFLATRGYSVRDYCALCGASVVGATEAEVSAVFDNDRRVVHVLEQACIDRLGVAAPLPTAAELSAMPRPVPPARPRTAWTRIMSTSA
jgi:hypothetical protein